MHIRVVLPVTGDLLASRTRAEVMHWVAAGTRVDVVALDDGPPSIESEYDAALASPGIMGRVQEAATDHVDGIFISCFSDPGVQAARELCDVPVVGGFEPAVLMALTLGERFGVITMSPSILPSVRSLARRYSLEGRLGGVRSVELPVLAVTNRPLLLDRLLEQASELVASGEAHVIVLGCTGMVGVAADLQSRLAEVGLGVPVVDPTAAAITWLESCVRLNLAPSRRTYSKPPSKTGVG